MTFRVLASTAATVEVVGDFNDWQGGATLLTPNGETLIATVDLEPGHLYRFRYLLDGQHWDADPGADRVEEAEGGLPEGVIDLTDLTGGAPQFSQRDEAGLELGERLRGRVAFDAVVLAVGRGAVEVGIAVAETLGLTFDGSPAGREAIVIDDAITDAAALADAAYHARGLGARRLLLAAPIGVRAVVEGLARDFDEIVVLDVVAGPPEMAFSDKEIDINAANLPECAAD